jgi:hypothetical protein
MTLREMSPASGAVNVSCGLKRNGEVTTVANKKYIAKTGMADERRNRRRQAANAGMIWARTNDMQISLLRTQALRLAYVGAARAD